MAAVAVADVAAVDALRERYDRMSLESLLERAFGGLAGLSLQRRTRDDALQCVESDAPCAARADAGHVSNVAAVCFVG